MKQTFFVKCVIKQYIKFVVIWWTNGGQDPLNFYRGDFWFKKRS